MKVLYYLPGTILGGAETQLLSLCKLLPKEKYQPVVATQDSNLNQDFWRELAQVARVVSCPTSQALFRALQAEKPDLVQHFHNSGMSLAMDEAGYTGPAIEIVHGCIHFPNDVTRTPKHHTSHVVAVSEDAKAFFLSELYEWQDKVSVIPNGIDTARFAPLQEKSRSRVLRIVHTGRLCEGDKRYKKIIEACRALPHKSWELWLVGTGMDYQEIFEYAKQMAPGMVKFFGFNPRPEQILAQADIYISRSPSEGFGLSIAEAASSGLPITMWDCGGVSRFFTHGKDALIANTDERFHQNLQALVKDAHLRKSLGGGGRFLAIQKFSGQAMAQGYMDLYEKLVRPRVEVVSQPSNRKLVGISNPNFVGVTHAVKNWVGEDAWISVPPVRTFEDQALQKILKQTPDVLLIGGDSNYIPLVQAVKKQRPSIKVLMTWHGTFSFNSFAPEDARLLLQWVRATRDGLVDRLGFVRDDMHKSFFGNKFVYFPNRIPKQENRTKDSKYKGGSVKIGIFGTGYPWKNQCQLVMGAAYIPGSEIHVNSIDPAFEELAVATGANIFKHGQLPRKEFQRILAGMDCNIQGGFTESFGLTFVESYRAGVPCMTTPGVKVLPGFLRTEVKDPDSAPAIAKQITSLIHNPQIDFVNQLLDRLGDKNEAQINKVLDDLCEFFT